MSGNINISFFFRQRNLSDQKDTAPCCPAGNVISPSASLAENTMKVQVPVGVMVLRKPTGFKVWSNVK